MYGDTNATPPPAPGRGPAQLDLGNVLKDSWSLAVKDIGPIIVAGLIPGAIVAVIAFIGFFVLWIPAAAAGSSNRLAGVAFLVAMVVWIGALLVAAVMTIPFSMAILRIVARRVREGRNAQVGDVMSCFDQWSRLVLAALALGLLIGLGFVLFIIPGVYLAVIWAYVLPLIVDRRLSLGEAMAESKRMVSESGFWMTLGVGFVVVLIGGVASGVTGNIGQVFVIPWQFVALMAMYFAASGEGGLLPSAYPGMPSSAYQGGAGAASPRPPWQPGPGMPPPPPPPGWGTPGWGTSGWGPPPPSATRPAGPMTAAAPRPPAESSSDEPPAGAALDEPPPSAPDVTPPEPPAAPTPPV